MSPLQIRMALAYYCSSEPEQFFPGGQWLSEAAIAAQEWMLDEKLIAWDLEGNQYRATDRLDAYVAKLKSIELPYSIVTWKFPGE